MSNISNQGISEEKYFHDACISMYHSRRYNLNILRIFPGLKMRTKSLGFNLMECNDCSNSHKVTECVFDHIQVLAH